MSGSEGALHRADILSRHRRHGGRRLRGSPAAACVGANQALTSLPLMVSHFVSVETR